MTYKMPVKQGQFDKGWRGIGKIRFSTDGNKIQVVMQAKIGKEFEQKDFRIDRENCPDYIEIAHRVKGKEWMVNVSKEGDKLRSFHPAFGHFTFKTQSFVSKKDEEPAPQLMQVEYPYEYFYVLLEILEPKEYAGLTVPMMLHYNFGEFVVDGKSIVGFSMGGKHTDFLEEYMLVSGILDDKYQPMDWKDNILPTLQRIALHEDRKFTATLKDGWISPRSLIQDDSDNNDDMPFDADEAVTTVTPTPAFTDTSFVDEEMEFEPDETNVD